jgi:hypothetical protein
LENALLTVCGICVDKKTRVFSIGYFVALQIFKNISLGVSGNLKGLRPKKFGNSRFFGWGGVFASGSPMNLANGKPSYHESVFSEMFCLLARHERQGSRRFTAGSALLDPRPENVPRLSRSPRRRPAAEAGYGGECWSSAMII